MSIDDDAVRTPANDAAGVPVTLEPPKVSAGFLTLYGLLNFGLYLTVMMPALFSLPYKVGLLAPDDKVILLGVVAAVGAVVGLFVGPAAGVLSDRTRSRFGRRRPWLVAGVLFALVGALIVGVSGSIAALLIGWVIVTLGGACLGAAVTPVVAERVPEAQRGLVGAIVGVATQLSGVLGYTIGGLLTENLVLLFLFPVLVLAVVALLWILFVPDPVREVSSTTMRETFQMMVFNPRKHPDFAFLWLGKLLMQMALAFLTTYQLYFVIDRLGFTAQEAGLRLSLVGGVGILVTMTFAIVSGMLSDRMKRRKVFVVVAAALAATGLVLMSLTNGFGLFFAAVLFILGSAGMFGSVDVAMASDLVPDPAQAGRWMTIYNLSATLSGAIAPVLAAGLLMIGGGQSNYTALFLTGALLTIGTAVTTILIRGVR